MAIVFKTDLDNRGFVRGLRGLETAATKTSRMIGNVFSAFGVGFGTTGLVMGARSLMESMSRINDEAAQVGLGVESFQRLQFAFEQGGASGQDFAKAMFTLNDKMEEANKEGGELAETFERLGVTKQMLESSDSEGAIFAIADALKEAGGRGQAMSDVVDVLGSKISRMLVPTLLEGSAGIREIGNSTTVASDEAVKAFDRMGDAALRFAKVGMVNAANAITDFGRAMKEAPGMTLAGLMMHGVGLGAFAPPLAKKAGEDAKPGAAPADGRKNLPKEAFDKGMQKSLRDFIRDDAPPAITRINPTEQRKAQNEANAQARRFGDRGDAMADRLEQAEKRRLEFDEKFGRAKEDPKKPFKNAEERRKADEQFRSDAKKRREELKDKNASAQAERRLKERGVQREKDRGLTKADFDAFANRFIDEFKKGIKDVTAL